MSGRNRPRRGTTLLELLAVAAFLAVITVGVATWSRLLARVEERAGTAAREERQASLAFRHLLGDLDQQVGAPWRIDQDGRTLVFRTLRRLPGQAPAAALVRWSITDGGLGREQPGDGTGEVPSGGSRPLAWILPWQPRRFLEREGALWLEGAQAELRLLARSRS